MIAGKLQYTMSYRHPEVMTDEYGAQMTVYSEPKKIRCNVTYNGYSRNNVNGDMLYDNDVNFEIRIYHDIKDFDIVTFQDTDYQIVAIEIDKLKQRKTLRCNKIVD